MILQTRASQSVRNDDDPRPSPHGASLGLQQNLAKVASLRETANSGIRPLQEGGSGANSLAHQFDIEVQSRHGRSRRQCKTNAASGGGEIEPVERGGNGGLEQAFESDTFEDLATQTADASSTDFRARNVLRSTSSVLKPENAN